ncbi:MAG: anthranilate phosphoribosyltransferase [Deltaproteobacteria bacterium]|jgi:anthranilate phosphoribosyltransferase|nr:anthranilate phosphoribosyltransferase [Deltaproteobacteria bacterium]
MQNITACDGAFAVVPHPPLTYLPPRRTAPAKPLRLTDIMETLAQGHDLAPDEARDAFAGLLDGDLAPAQAGALLLGLRAKGETPEEMGAAVTAVLERAVPVPPVQGTCIDVVGTGGDAKSSFNCSTAVALSLAGLGHKVLKHGNRSVSSRCGSADVLELLGIPLDVPPEEVPHVLERENFVFLFAPRYHPSFKHVMPIRRELGVRTVFNLLGPLVNPARPTHHFLGVARPEHLPLVAGALARASQGQGAVVHGAGGYDELTPLGRASLMFVRHGTTRPGSLDPADYGFASCTEQDLAVSGPEEAALRLRELLRGGGPEPMRDTLALNLGFALYLLGEEGAESLDPARGFEARRMHEAMTRARQAVRAGAGGVFCHA